MASSIPCGPCSHDSIHKNADTWCADCNEGFCSICEKAHKSMKMSRDHNFILIKDYREIENINIVLECQEHESKFEMYCKIHEIAICMKCFPAKHKGCSDAIVPIAEAAKNAKTSTAFVDLDHAINDTIDNIEGYVKDRESATKRLESQEMIIKKVIFDTRDSINKHLDNLERKMLNELSTTYTYCKSKYGKYKNQIDQIERDIRQLKKQTSQLKRFASNLQVFLSTHQMKEEVQDKVNYLKDTIRSVKDFNIEIEIQQEITSLLKDVNCFGRVKVDESATGCQFKERQIVQAAQLEVQKRRYVHNTKLQLQKKFTIKQNGSQMYITGCTLLPNGNLLIADHDGHSVLMEYNEEGHFVHDIPVSANPFDLTTIEAVRLAVSYFDLNYIEVIDLKNFKVLKKIKLKKRCQGISYNDGKIFVAVIEKGIVVLDMDGNKIKTIKCGLNVCNITTIKERIYYVLLKQGTVYCCSTSGEKIWNFDDGSLIPAGGMATDSDQNVFVVGIKSNNLLMLQNNGEVCKTILTEADGLQEPTRVCFNKEKNILLVCNKRNGSAFLFSVK